MSYLLRSEKNIRVRLLHRYIFRQVLIACILSLALFVFVLVAGNAIRQIIGLVAGGRLSIGEFLYFIGLLIPGVAAYALPLGLLTGILLVLGRLSAQSEIQAMKAAGISLYTIAAPILLIAMLGSVFSLWVTFHHGPRANVAFREGLANIVRNDPLRFIQPGIFITEFPGYVIYAGSRDGTELRDFWIWELDSSARATILLRATQGNFLYDEEGDALVLTLLNGTAERRSPGDPENFRDLDTATLGFEEVAIRLSLESILGKNHQTTKLAFMTLDELREQRGMFLRNDGNLPPELALRGQIAAQMQIQKNFATGLSILSLALVAIPLGIKASRTETLANLALALALAMSYYLAIIFISYLESYPQFRPDLLVWLPNIAFQALGITLLSRANR